MKNGVATSQTATYTVGNTIPAFFSDTTNNVTVADGDEVCYRVTTSAGTGTTTVYTITNTFEADSNTYTELATCHATGQTVTDNTTRFFVFNGLISSQTTESVAYMKFKKGGTLKKGFVYISQNGVSSNSTMRMRKNGANANIVITITGSTTGIFEDTSNTDTVSLDEQWNWSVAVPSVAGTQTITIMTMGIGFETTDSSFPIVSNSLFTQNANLTQYISLGSPLASLTEANEIIYNDVAYTAKQFIVSVTANTVSSNSTLTFRINGVDKHSITITASTTGFFEESPDTDYDVAIGDTINFKLITPNAGTSLSTQQIGLFAVPNIASGASTITNTLLLLGAG